MYENALSEDTLNIANCLIPRLEGCRLVPYQDVAGYWTIGIGNRCLADGSPVVESTDPITWAEAVSLCQMTITKKTAPRVISAIPFDLQPYQWAALYSLAYNIGTTAFQNSTICRLIGQNALGDAAQHFLDWVHSGGKIVPALAHRRTVEMHTFLGLYDPVLNSPKLTTIVPAIKPMYDSQPGADALMAAEQKQLDFQ